MPKSFKNFFSNQQGRGELIILALMIGIATVLVGGFSSFHKPLPPASNTPSVHMVDNASTSKNSLQIAAPQVVTTVPTTVVSTPVQNVCPLDGSPTNGCTCGPFQADDINGNHLTLQEQLCQSYSDPNCEIARQCHSCNTPEVNTGIGPVQWCYMTVERTPNVKINCAAVRHNFDVVGGAPLCVGKPVIYLYPLKDTLVDVKLSIPGTIYKSIPTYPDQGWENVLAHPGGSLEYQNKHYSELYYESQINNVVAPKTGIIIPRSELKERLTELTGKLGLLPTEQQEFLSYWMPKLEDLNKPYILFSIIDQSEKERIDHVDITPQPDTFIAFLVYFKPLDIPVAVEPLNLPKTPPQRVGFTAVEWGGTIDY